MPLVGSGRGRFEEAVTFFNMRGRVESDFTDDITECISKLSDTFVLVVDKSSFQTHGETLTKIVSRFSSVIVIIANSLEKSDITKLEKFRDNLPSSLLIKVVSTHKGVTQMNPKEMVAQLQNILPSHFREYIAKSLDNRLSELSHLPNDEKGPEYIKGKEKALEIFQSMTEIGKEGQWKRSITPVHYIHSKRLGSYIKMLYRLKDIKETCNVEEKIKQLREEQLEHISEPVKLFIQSVVDDNDSPRLKQYFLRWLSIFLENEKRKQLPRLISQNQLQRQNAAGLKNKTSPNDKELELLSNEIVMSQELIEDATLGIEHLFREMGHIYEAFIVLHKSPGTFELPSVETLIQAMVSFLNQGHTFEIVDGDNFYLPSNWVRSVLEKMSQNINMKKVLTLSVLGVQSSGKSTLLNSLFGSQFPVKSGRCTRGIHMQVLQISSSNNLPFYYVIVIDSEGLRATEFSSRGHSHDNELSTVIAGLGDITLVNVMGENTTEIRDIVQVVVHAFLKLKLVNKQLDIGKMFYLVHQNVMDISAPDNMRTGLHVLMETLDLAAKDAGEIEGTKEITTFRQVIDFDINANVWYLPNYWQGNPPMARVNSDYIERIFDHRYKLLEKALACTDKSYKSLNDIALHMQDLWKGVLTEDFVFCFRNSLEIKAYIQMEEALKDILIKFENVIENEHVITSQKLFSECIHQNQVQNAADKLIKQMRDVLTENVSDAIIEMKEYCEKNDYKETILQWEDFAINRIKSLSNELDDRIKRETVRLRDRACVELTIKEKSLQHEAELYEKSLQVAKTIKGECLHMEEIENKFEQTWEIISREIINFGALQDAPESLSDNFEKCLFDIFNTEKLILKSELQKQTVCHKPGGKCEDHFSCTSVFRDMKSLTRSFSSSGIDLDDISFSTEIYLEENDAKLLRVEKVADNIFEEIDTTVDNCLTDRDEVSYREVRRVLLKAHKEMLQTQTQNVGFTFKITGVVKLCLHVSYFAYARFKAYNAEYAKNNGILAKLDKYKCQVREQFIAYVKDRKAEEAAAKQIIAILENVLWDKIKERLHVTIKTALKQNLPQLKFHLIIEVLEDMANADDFESFVKYIKNPRKFVKQWMKRKAETYLFGSNMVNFSQLATGIINEFYDDIKRSVDKSCDLFRTENPSTEKWIEIFTKHFSKCAISKSEFQNVTKFLCQIEDIRNFSSILIENLNVSVENVKQKSNNQAKIIVKFTGPDSPLKSLFKQAWGCPDQCAFCGEPCAKGFSHSGTNHYSLQHRISCCSGAREDYTHKASITSCNFNVQSEQMHHCDLFGFRCNPPQNMKPCELKWHNYKDYKDFIPDWDIEPNANMSDCSKFWMWFVATYKYQLAVEYRYDISYIPDAWDDITKADALANLRRIYTT
ncbi:interferon-induced very large GTPase 1-like [Mercenaria mercenaria]|uniref:interferon-induced very large GTPase 1-like n=1 Tax=Mercenaria mercenaria TaxID=6596 RepID=UPI00234EE17F|nr:interferon-induced very large GTPase 1-like [Mercenaria mercenaria]